MNELSESVKTALTTLKKKKCEGDVYGIAKRTITYSILKGELSDSSEFEDIGVGIRAVKDQRTGFGYCVPGAEEKGVKKALDLSTASPEQVIPFPDTALLPPVTLFDKKVVNEANDGKGAEFAQQLIDGTVSVKDDIIPTGGQINIVISSRVVGNTHGVVFQEDETAVFCGVIATIPGERTSLSAIETESSRKFDIDFEDVGVRAGEKVDSMREKSSIDTGVYSVVVSPYALAQLLWFAVIPAFLGENVRKGKSVYEGKIGNPVACETLCITDDPTADWGLGSGAFDDEGVTSVRVPLITDGVVKNFLYDLKDSVKSSTTSTGNGMRANFKIPPETKDRNVVVRGEEYTKDALVEGDGLYVDNVMGAHTANEVSGDFSVVANPVWLIKKGEMQGRLDGVMISGNLPELLQEIELADDYKKTAFFLGGQRVFSMDLPTARLENIAVSGN